MDSCGPWARVCEAVGACGGCPVRTAAGDVARSVAKLPPVGEPRPARGQRRPLMHPAAPRQAPRPRRHYTMSCWSPVQTSWYFLDLLVHIGTSWYIVDLLDTGDTLCTTGR